MPPLLCPGFGEAAIDFTGGVGVDFGLLRKEKKPFLGALVGLIVSTRPVGTGVIFSAGLKEKIPSRPIFSLLVSTARRTITTISPRTTVKTLLRLSIVL